MRMDGYLWGCKVQEKLFLFLYLLLYSRTYLPYICICFIKWIATYWILRYIWHLDRPRCGIGMNRRENVLRIIRPRTETRILSTACQATFHSAHQTMSQNLGIVFPDLCNFQHGAKPKTGSINIYQIYKWTLPFLSLLFYFMIYKVNLNSHKSIKLSLEKSVAKWSNAPGL